MSHSLQIFFELTILSLIASLEKSSIWPRFCLAELNIWVAMWIMSPAS
jgi:hypothetical protein